MAECGRPTRAGAACRALLQWYEAACSVHATPLERAEAYRRLRAAEFRAECEEFGCIDEHSGQL